MCSGVGGWHQSKLAGGCQSAPPSVSGSGLLSRRPWGTRTVTLPQCVGHLPHSRLLASHTCGSGRGIGWWGPPARPPPVGVGRVVSHPLPCPLLGVPTLRLCLCTGERTFLSEMLPSTRGLPHHWAPVHWASGPARAHQRNPAWRWVVGVNQAPTRDQTANIYHRPLRSAVNYSLLSLCDRWGN